MLKTPMLAPWWILARGFMMDGADSGAGLWGPSCLLLINRGSEGFGSSQISPCTHHEARLSSKSPATAGAGIP